MKYHLNQFVEWESPTAKGSGVIRGWVIDASGPVYLVGSEWVEEGWITTKTKFVEWPATPRVASRRGMARKKHELAAIVQDQTK